MKRDHFNVRIDEVRELATKYSKPDLQRMVQMGLVEPQKAVMAGMMIDRIAKSSMQPPQTTVAQDILGMAPTAEGQGIPPQMGQEQAPPQMAQQMPPQMPAMAADGGIMGALPYSDGVAALPTNIPDYAGGGIIAFADRGAVKDPYKVEKAEYESVAVPELRTPQTEMTRIAEMQKAFGFKPEEFFSKRGEEATKEREKLQARSDDAARQAFIKGSLKAAAGKSPYALTNIAEGALGGVEAYEGEKKDIREQQRLLREADRKDAEAQFLNKRGDVDAAGKRIDESEKLRMAAEEKNIEMKNKAEADRAKAETEKGANIFKETEATKRVGMQVAAQNQPGAQERVLNRILALRAQGKTLEADELQKTYTTLSGVSGTRAGEVTDKELQDAYEANKKIYKEGAIGAKGREEYENFMRQYPTWREFAQAQGKSGQAPAQPTGGATNQPPPRQQFTEGQEAKDANGKPIVFKSGQWVYK